MGIWGGGGGGVHEKPIYRRELRKRGLGQFAGLRCFTFSLM